VEFKIQLIDADNVCMVLNVIQQRPSFHFIGKRIIRYLGSLGWKNCNNLLKKNNLVAIAHNFSQRFCVAKAK
jgi:hypothetical protein